MHRLSPAFEVKITQNRPMECASLIVIRYSVIILTILLMQNVWALKSCYNKNKFVLCPNK